MRAATNHKAQPGISIGMWSFKHGNRSHMYVCAIGFIRNGWMHLLLPWVVPKLSPHHVPERRYSTEIARILLNRDCGHYYGTDTALFVDVPRITQSFYTEAIMEFEWMYDRRLFSNDIYRDSCHYHHPASWSDDDWYKTMYCRCTYVVVVVAIDFDIPIHIYEYKWPLMYSHW